MTTPSLTGSGGWAQFRAELWLAAVIVCGVLGVLGVLLLAAGNAVGPGPSSFTVLMVENASATRVRVTPMGNRSNSRWNLSLGERGILLIDKGEKWPGPRVSRFEIAPGASWTTRFDREVKWLMGIVVEDEAGTTRIVRLETPEKPWEDLTVRIVDLAALPALTAQEAAWYAGIREMRGIDWWVVVCLLPLLNLPWVWWMWRRARGRVRLAPSPSGL